MINDVVIIGAGKIAYSLSAALKHAGFNISCIYSRSLAPAKELAALADAPLYTNSFQSIPHDSRALYILAVPDGQIKAVAGELARLEISFSSSYFIHLSGALDISTLKSLSDAGAATGSLHIMQTFPSRSVFDIKGSYSAIEALDTKVEEFLMDLAERLGLIPFKIESEGKAFYHLSGVFACNFIASNFFSADFIFRKSGIKDAGVFDVMKPIVDATLNNIETRGAVNAISGPVDRGDYPTVKKHLELFQSTGTLNTEMLLSRLNYISNSLLLVEISERKYGGLNSGQLKIKEILLEELKTTAGMITSLKTPQE